MNNFYVTLQGKTDTAVVIHDIKVNVIKRDDPSTIRSTVRTCPIGGGATGFRRLMVDVSAGVTKLTDPDTGPDPEVPSRFPLQVAKSDPEVFQIETDSHGDCLCSWKLSIRWTSGADSGVEEVVRDFGEPFRTYESKGTLPNFDWSGDELVPAQS